MSRALTVALFALCSGTGFGLATGAIAVEASSIRLDLPEVPGLGDALREPRFHLKHVEFVGLGSLTEEHLGAALDLPRDLPLVDLDVARVCAKIAEHPRVSHCAGLRVPPDRIVIEVDERTPIARIADTDHGLDADGVTVWLVPDERERLPRVYGDAPAIFALPLLEALAERELVPRTVRVRNARDLTFTLPDAAAVLRVGRDLGASLARFDAWTSAAPARLAVAREVDLRFGEQAVLRALDPEKQGGKPDGSS